MLAVTDAVGDARAAFTDRHGGVSAGPYASLNLGDHVGDDPAAVAENRRRVAVACGADRDRLVVARQVHGAHVVEASGPWDGDPPEADGMVTRVRGLVLAVLVADCTPVVLLADGVVGVAHVGRKGLVAGTAVRVVEAMRALGAEDVVARVGPSICPRCYEVPEQMRADVAAGAPAAHSVDRRGRPALDVAAGAVEQLAPHCTDVQWLHGCTAESSDLFSYRGEGVTGRFAGLAWLRP